MYVNVVYSLGKRQGVEAVVFRTWTKHLRVGRGFGKRGPFALCCAHYMPRKSILKSTRPHTHRKKSDPQCSEGRGNIFSKRNATWPTRFARYLRKDGLGRDGHNKQFGMTMCDALNMTGTSWRLVPTTRKKTRTSISKRNARFLTESSTPIRSKRFNNPILTLRCTRGHFESAQRRYRGSCQKQNDATRCRTRQQKIPQTTSNNQTANHPLAPRRFLLLWTTFNIL